MPTDVQLSEFVLPSCKTSSKLVGGQGQLQKRFVIGVHVCWYTVQHVAVTVNGGDDSNRWAGIGDADGVLFTPGPDDQWVQRR